MNIKQFGILKKGVKHWNKWWNSLPRKGVVVWDIGQEAPKHETVDLSYADLSNMDLSGYIFENAELEGTKFKNTNLMNADLSCSNCKEADFSKAIMRNTLLDFAILNRAMFKGADLRGNKGLIIIGENETIDLKGAILEGSEFRIIHEELKNNIFRAKSIKDYKSGVIIK